MARPTARRVTADSLRLRLEAQQLRDPSLHALLPLELAVRTIFRRVYEERLAQAVSSRHDAHLDGLAYTVASLSPIYVCQDLAGKNVRRLSGEELSTGLFRDGARDMHFMDGRPPLRGLALHVDAVQRIIEILLHELPD